MTQMERRSRRSDDPCKALFYQLDTSCERSELEAVILADDEGMCVAASGDPEMCDEVAAHLAIVGHHVPTFDGVLFAADTKWDIHMRRFQVDGADLFMCAVGGSLERRRREVSHSIGGTTRILVS